MQSHVENPACASCHRLMDPIGFGLENFDAIGRWRDKEADRVRERRSATARKTVELPIDGKGEIAGLPNSAFSEPQQIGRVLADSRACQECVVKQVFRYAFGRLETRRRSRDRSPSVARRSAIRDSGSRSC